MRSDSRDKSNTPAERRKTTMRLWLMVEAPWPKGKFQARTLRMRLFFLDVPFLGIFMGFYLGDTHMVYIGVSYTGVKLWKQIDCQGKSVKGTGWLLACCRLLWQFLDWADPFADSQTDSDQVSGYSPRTGLENPNRNRSASPIFKSQDQGVNKTCSLF